MSRSRIPIGLSAQLLKPTEAAELLNVSDRTIHDWIAKDCIPYVGLPGAGDKHSYRIPLQGLLNSLSGTYDLVADLESVYAEPAEPASAEPASAEPASAEPASAEPASAAESGESASAA